LDTFAARNVQLTFIFDSYGGEKAHAHKLDTLQERMEETLDEVCEVLDFCKSGATPRRGALGSRIPMPMLTMTQAKAAIKRKGASLFPLGT
jgi:hypothetical protein